MSGFGTSKQSSSFPRLIRRVKPGRRHPATSGLLLVLGERKGTSARAWKNITFPAN
jgi:hypothetical protein